MLFASSLTFCVNLSDMVSTLHLFVPDIGIDNVSAITIL